MNEANTSTKVSEVSHVALSNRYRRLWWLIIGSCLVCGGMGLWVFWKSNPESAYQRARAALVTGDRETVLREADFLIKIPKYQYHGWLLKGLLLSRLGKLDQAIAYLEKAAQSKTLAVEANTIAAQCFYQSGLYLQAIHASERALKQDESSVDARRWLAVSYYDLGAIANAIEELKRVSTAAPKDPRPTRLLGLISKDSESYSDAVQYYRESLKRDPDQPEILLELAECELKENQPAEALATLKRCDPSPAVSTLTAECLISAGQLQEAQDVLNDVLKRDPRNFPALLVLGKLHLDQGSNPQAIEVLNKAIELQPFDSQTHFQLSQAMRRVGDVAGADLHLTRMQELQNLEREFSSLHNEASDHPNDAGLRSRAGEVARRLGKLKLARLWFRAALAIDPTDHKSRTALNELDRSN